MQTASFSDTIKPLIQDAIVYKAVTLWASAASDPDAHAKTIYSIAKTIACIDNPIKRDSYVDIINKELKLKNKWLKNSVEGIISEDDDKSETEDLRKLPEWADEKRVYIFGLDWQKNVKHKTGYYFLKSGNALEQLTNFVLEPLFHIYDRTGGNRRVARLHNSINPDQLIELPSKAMNSLDRFEEVLLDEGYFLTMEGFSKNHLKRLIRAIANDFPKTQELKVLGWQPEGFWAYSDAIFDGENLSPFNEIGIAKFKETQYYSPSASPIHITTRKDEHGDEINDDDPYENDKYLRYKPTVISAENYMQHMMKMHGENGMPLICYAFVSIFKDIITRYEKCPLLYGYGLVQSGKSTWAEGLYYLFYDSKSKPFNLNQGTLYAFFNRMERNRNCPQLFNEFDENFIAEEFFRAFKAFYDGEGRDRGKGIKGKTESQKTNCTIILTGQTLTTKDGASVLIRSIPVHFKDKGERSEEETSNYQAWVSWINAGMNGALIQILQHRSFFLANFSKYFNEELIKLKIAMRESDTAYKERIMKNYCILLASGKLMLEKMQLGFTYQQLYDYCHYNIIKLSQMITQVDNLAIFWRSFAFLNEINEITDGCDYKIAEELSVKGRRDKEMVTIPFDKVTKVLYLRLTKSYPLFARNYRQQHGSNPIKEDTLISYFDSNKSYLGFHSGVRFKTPDGRTTAPTSCYMFRYDDLGINLEREEDTVDDNRVPEIFEAELSKMPEIVDTGGVEKLLFSVVSYENKVKEGISETVTVYTKCFYKDTDIKAHLFIKSKVKLTGLVSIKKKKEFVNRTMEVEKLEIKKTGFQKLEDTEEF